MSDHVDLNNLYSSLKTNLEQSEIDCTDPTTDLRSKVRQSLESANIEPQQPAIEAAVSTVDMLHSDQEKQSTDLSTLSVESNVPDVVLSGPGGDIHTANPDQISQEIFNGGVVEQDADADHILFNVLASYQDPFAEVFFPTQLVSPDKQQLSVTIHRQELVNAYTHPTSGQLPDIDRHVLFEAFRDQTLLQQNTDELIPYANTDGSNDAYFVDTSYADDELITVEDIEIPTRPLLLGQRVNLIGLSQHPSLASRRNFDITDNIAPGLRLRSLFIELTDGDTTELVGFDTQWLARSQFFIEQEGPQTQLGLNFTAQTLILGSHKQTATGQSVTLLNTATGSSTTLADYEIWLTARVYGQANADTGETEVFASNPSVYAIYRSSNQIDLDSTEGQNVVSTFEDLSPRWSAYKLSGKRYNTNMRSLGSLVDTRAYTQRYALLPQEPVSVAEPADSFQRASTTSALASAARVQTSTHAVTTILNYADHLRQQQPVFEQNEIGDLFGAGKYLVQPYYNYQSLDMESVVTNQRYSSAGPFEAIPQVLFDTLREQVYDMLDQSNYLAVLRSVNADAATKPIVAIGTDPQIERHLYISDSTRILGSEVDYRLVSSVDKRMRGKIFLTFTREKPGSQDGLTFGTHGFMPEFIRRVTHTRDSGPVTYEQAIPRSMHVPILPVLAEIDVSNIDSAKEYVKNNS